MSTSAIDYDAINRAALAACPDLLSHWFPNGNLVGNEFKVGNLSGDPGDSLSINIRTGKWADFAADHRGGDIISLYAAKEGLRQAAAAMAVAREVGQEHMVKPRKAKAARANKGDTKLRPVMPVPGDAPDPDFRNTRLGMPSQTWAYHDAEGRRLGYTCRFDRPGGEKEILPITFWQANDGRFMWKWKGFPTPRPLYGLDELARKPNANVVLVEGEKTTDAARKLFPGCAVVTWPGGGKAIKHVDWSPLKGRKVLIIPDADEPGREAADGYTDNHGVFNPGIAQRLAGIAAGVRVVDPPDGVPEGWDMADALEEGWSPNWAATFVRKHMRDPAAPPQPAPEPPSRHEPEPPPEGDGPVPTVVDEQPHFRVLGYNNNTFFFMSLRARQVMAVSSSGLRDRGNLIALAPLQYWEREFPSKCGFAGAAVDQAVNALVEACYRAGVFVAERMRGRGAWWDDGRVIMHCGDRLIVDGRETDLTAIESRYTYAAAPPIPCRAHDPLPAEEARRLQELCDMLMWKKPVYGALLAGWCVVAPICGALTWRPHIWITSAAGGGKTWVMDHIVRRVLGDFVLPVIGATTEAGIRQTLGRDARPVLFDEAEGENKKAASVIECVLALMRQASSETGGQIIKGTTSGRAMSFNIRSCFVLASINETVKQHADATRTTVVELVRDNTAEGLEHFAKRVNPTAQELLTPEYCLRFQARAIRHAGVVRRNAEAFAAAVAERLSSRRLGDQIGALLAGAYLLQSDGVVGADEAREWVAERDWSDQEEVLGERDEEKLLAKIMAHIVRVDAGGRTVERSIRELIARTAGIGVDQSDPVTADVALRALKRRGMKVKDGALLVSNTHDALQKILHGTRWEAGWERSLKRIEGAGPSKNTERFDGGKDRATRIPLSKIVVEE